MNSQPDIYDHLALEMFMAGGIQTPFKPEDQPNGNERSKYPCAKVKYMARRMREEFGQIAKGKA
jgi:hypothetical protein